MEILVRSYHETSGQRQLAPLLHFDDFALDFDTIKEVKSCKINLNDFASFDNCIMDRYVLAGFKIEAEGTNIFTLKLVNSDIILLNTHPFMLNDA